MKIKFEFNVGKALGVAIGLNNRQPKKDYKNAWWELDLLILCFHFYWRLSYPYKN
jgi:hypothetical protein